MELLLVYSRGLKQMHVVLLLVLVLLLTFEVAAVGLLVVVVQAGPMETAAVAVAAARMVVAAVAAEVGEAGGLSILGFRVLQVATQHQYPSIDRALSV